MADLIAVQYASKASGVYREILDATASALQTTAPCNVVVVIQSEYGPFMKPVLIEDATQLHTMFGNRDARLEARGSYGILMAEHVLEQGPIWVLNIKNINPQSETVQCKELACSKNESDGLLNKQINEVYDTSRFWNIPLVYGTYGDGAVLSFTSVLNGTSTVIVRKYTGTDYNYTIRSVKEKHSAFIGQGLDDDAFVADYLVIVDVFKTDLMTAKLSVENAFIGDELNLSKIEEIKADPAAMFYAEYQGSIGDVIDEAGTNLSISTVINADTYAHGIYCAINKDAMLDNGIDLAGKQLFEFDDTGATLPTISAQSRLGYKIQPMLQNLDAEVNKYSRNVAYVRGPIGFKADSVFADHVKTLRLVDQIYVGNEYSLGDRVPGTIDAPVQGENCANPGQPYPKNSAGTPVYPSTAVKAGQPVVYDEVTKKVKDYLQEDVEEKNSITFTLNEIQEGNTEILVRMMLNGSLVEKSVVSTGIDDDNAETKLKNDLEILFNSFLKGVTFEVTYTKDTKQVVANCTNVVRQCRTMAIGEIVQDGDIINGVVVSGTSGNVASFTTRVTEFEVTLPATYDSEALAELYGDSVQLFKLTFDQPIAEHPDDGEATLKTYAGTQVTTIACDLVYINNWALDESLFRPIVLTGIVSLEKHFVNGTAARQKEILDMLQTAGITNSFIDPTVFRCRYMVDTFKTYIEPNAKYQYATLAGQAKRFLVFIPGPFYHELLASKNPDFHDLFGEFQMSYVKNGKNPDKPSTNTFAFVQDSETSKYLVPVMNAYYNNGFEDTIVPLTGAVAKLFYSKHTGTKKIYDIVAGQSWPISASGITNPEFEPNIEERAYMEQMGLNVVQKLNGVLQLRSNVTAYQFVESAFNYPETLEKVFYVSDMVEPTLDGTLFKYNNADTRLSVKKKADDVCDQLVSDGAITAYNNICDLSNNPIEVRKAGIMILDTELYNEYGIRIAIHRSTIKTEETSE